MLDHLLDSGFAKGPGSRALVGLSVSFGAHLLALGALMAGAFLVVGTVHRPPAPLADPERMVFITRPPAAAAAAAPPGSSTPRERRRREPADWRPDEMVQPEALPEEIPADTDGEEPYDEEEFEEGIQDGHPGGVPGGIPGGTPGGVAGGDPDGIAGGLLGGEGREAAPHGLSREIVFLTGEVRKPEKIHDVAPDYPEAARRARLEGRVILNLAVGRDGSVEDVAVVSGNALFRRAAVEAARRWRYRPALQSGRPVRISMLVVVEFRLR